MVSMRQVYSRISYLSSQPPFIQLMKCICSSILPNIYFQCFPQDIINILNTAVVRSNIHLNSQTMHSLSSKVRMHLGHLNQHHALKEAGLQWKPAMKKACIVLLNGRIGFFIVYQPSSCPNSIILRYSNGFFNLVHNIAVFSY